MEFVEEIVDKEAIIKIIGLGGGGSNAVDYMAKNYKANVSYICANTDTKALRQLSVDKKIELGSYKITKGLGAGMKSSVGREAALENRNDIKNAIKDSDMLFIAVGMGGGTGTGSAPIVADIAKELGILTVAVVTKPFTFEGNKKQRIANEGITKLISVVDSLIVLPNDRLIDTLSKEFLNSNIDQVFALSDDVLASSVNAIAELTTSCGRMNIDFSDVCTVMSMPGKAMIGSGVGSGENRASEAVNKAISNPLIEEVSLSNAKGVLINVTCAPSQINIIEYHSIGNIVAEYADEDADIKIGLVEDVNLKDDIRVTIIVTGLDQQRITYNNSIINTTPKSIIDHNVVVKEEAVKEVLTAQEKQPENIDNKTDIPAYLKRRQLS